VTADGGAGPQREPIVLDCLGRRCPQPVIELARAIRSAAPGTVVRVLADDPAAAGDIAAWCRMRDQEFLPSDQPHTFQVRKRA
jgi:tRNA 2-thiouridine synthesizing protein A